MSKEFLKDLGERVASTAAQAGIGVAVVELSDLSYWWIVPLVSLLTAVKGRLARAYGSDPESASLVK